MSSFKKKCTFCGQEIQLTNDSGRWLPHNLDNTFHDCRSNENKDKSPQTQQPQNKSSSTLSLESIDARLKRIEHTLYGDK